MSRFRNKTTHNATNVGLCASFTHPVGIISPGFSKYSLDHQRVVCNDSNGTAGNVMVHPPQTAHRKARPFLVESNRDRPSAGIPYLKEDPHHEVAHENKYFEGIIPHHDNERMVKRVSMPIGRGPAHEAGVSPSGVEPIHFAGPQRCFMPHTRFPTAVFFVGVKYSNENGTLGHRRKRLRPSAPLERINEQPKT